MAEGLVETLLRRGCPSPGKSVDFGIDSLSHLGALQHAVENGVTAYDLDRVIGDGRAITALVRSVPRQPYPALEFHTAWDVLVAADEEAIEL